MKRRRWTQDDRKRWTRRGMYIIPSFFTVSNIFCGFYSVSSAMRGNYELAGILIGIAMILDTLDGRIARLTHTASEFGVQLDSLADVITFGVAP
ncbi:CDP-alcohol phosphatidyltransferase family protein, partial [bacterium]|nr:CDP-alcohol phosphatidyltransferase family protein [bacterium]